jgi:alpha-L-fucosidase
VNGEAIYGTRPREGDLWREGDHVRFTRSKDDSRVYAITDEWPGAVLTLRTVRAIEGSAVTLLGLPGPLEWTQDGRELSIRLPASLADPARRPCGTAWAFRIQASR